MTTAKGRVLVVAAHPDDPESLAGGTIAQLAKEGREIAYVVVTTGNKGSVDRNITSKQLIPIREDEQRRAARVARDHLSFPELLPDHEPHKMHEVYLVQWEQPRLAVDITDTMELKLEAIRCHKSQVPDFEAVEARMRNRAATLGKGNGYSYAEGFDQIVVPG